MRNLVPAVALVVLASLTAFGLPRGARGEDAPQPAPAPVPEAAPAPEPAPAALQNDMELLLRRVEALERQNRYLLSREHATTTYLLTLERTASDVERLVGQLRANGFAAAANPSPTRDDLLRGLDTFAKSLRKGLPAVTSAETELLASVPR